MPQAVSQLTTPSLQQITSTSSVQRRQDDGESFRDALNRAKGSESADAPEHHDATPEAQQPTSRKAVKPSEPQKASSGKVSSADSKSAGDEDGATDAADSTSTTPDQNTPQAATDDSSSTEPEKPPKPAKKVTTDIQDQVPADPTVVVNPRQTAPAAQPSDSAEAEPGKCASHDSAKQTEKKALPVAKKAVDPAASRPRNLIAVGNVPTDNAAADESTPTAAAEQAPTQEVAPVGTLRLAVQAKGSADPSSPAASNTARNPTAGQPVGTLPEVTDDLEGADDAVLDDPVPSAAHATTKTLDEQSPALQPTLNQTPGAHQTSGTVGPGHVPVAPPETRFADENHPQIVSGIQGKLLPNGGSMHIRLDPPELGALNVHVSMKDGVMTASFETTNDQASKLLSHSLGDLKTALEAQGVNVEKLHVTQSPRQQFSSSRDNSQRNADADQNSAQQQEQQRKELLRRMWRKLSNGQDPLDLVA